MVHERGGHSRWARSSISAWLHPPRHMSRRAGGGPFDQGLSASLDRRTHPSGVVYHSTSTRRASSGVWVATSPLTLILGWLEGESPPMPCIPSRVPHCVVQRAPLEGLLFAASACASKLCESPCRWLVAQGRGRGRRQPNSWPDRAPHLPTSIQYKAECYFGVASPSSPTGKASLGRLRDGPEYFWGLPPWILGRVPNLGKQKAHVSQVTFRRPINRDLSNPHCQTLDNEV